MRKTKHDKRTERRINMFAKELGSISETRMLTADQGEKYTGMGQNKFRRWADGIGATRKFGKVVRFDKVVIDKALDALNSEPVEV